MNDDNACPRGGVHGWDIDEPVIPLGGVELRTIVRCWKCGEERVIDELPEL